MRVPGFRFAGVAAGIKKTGRPDVALVAADTPATCAAVFTRNRMRAAPVELSAARVRGGRLSAIVVNSGNANACTPNGSRDAEEMARRAAHAIGAEERHVAVASTGVIGAALPMAKVRKGIADAGRLLSDEGWNDFSQAILTTDKGPKVHIVRAGGIVIAGCAKGAGMIAPNMATTLAFVVTDARVAAPELRRLVKRTADATFNRVLVDGDTSTNDSLFCMASGRAAAPRGFATALHEVCEALALMLVRDGEGSAHVVRIEVGGAATDAAAERVARRIANSPLVKTAIAGADPNWGRIVAAIGNAGVALRPERLAVWLDRVQVVRGGVGVAGCERRAHTVMSRPSYTIRVELGSGRASAHATTCDLTHEYVTINASYRS